MYMLAGINVKVDPCNSRIVESENEGPFGLRPGRRS